MIMNLTQQASGTRTGLDDSKDSDATTHQVIDDGNMLCMLWGVMHNKSWGIRRAFCRTTSKKHVVLIDIIWRFQDLSWKLSIRQEVVILANKFWIARGDNGSLHLLSWTILQRNESTKNYQAADLFDPNTGDYPLQNARRDALHTKVCAPLFLSKCIPSYPPVASSCFNSRDTFTSHKSSVVWCTSRV